MYCYLQFSMRPHFKKTSMFFLEQVRIKRMEHPDMSLYDLIPSSSFDSCYTDTAPTGSRVTTVNPSCEIDLWLDRECCAPESFSPTAMFPHYNFAYDETPSRSSSPSRLDLHYQDTHQDYLYMQETTPKAKNMDCKTIDMVDTSFRVNHFDDFKPFKHNDPFAPSCQIPLPTVDGGNPFEHNFIRRRNERERDRVRSVNDGYARLKECLPIANKHKRVSKVDTLKHAIEYIKYMQDILNDTKAPTKTLKNANECKKETNICTKRKKVARRLVFD